MSGRVTKCRTHRKKRKNQIPQEKQQKSGAKTPTGTTGKIENTGFHRKNIKNQRKKP